ncbi:glycosyltransferase family 2 protein [Psychroserpens sp. XS_ASV72]|uniref:glycosyltransferase family 2 protein n=1 Tax=Psychroserpens sp. XS_ASV72 TaxID=3241293 RepID=UPI0035146092
MISILIPVYNYNVVPLVTHVHTQLELCNVQFEIICYDDGSQSNFTLENKGITNLSYTEYITGSENVGRIKARQILAETSKFNWLLFLDADVIPKPELFISNYLTFLDSDYDAIYGGFAYHKDRPEPRYLLRWTYGKNNEEVSATIRNKRPYKIVISANFLIKKSLFLNINSRIKRKGYGYDNYFGAILKSENANVLHIDNEVFHLGLDTNSDYLKKTEEAVETLRHLYKNDEIKTHQNDLLTFFKKLKVSRIHYLFSFVFRLLKSSLKKNLLGNNPSIKLFQFYKIGYMCYKESSK